MAKTETPRWRTTMASYLDHNLVAEGEEVDYTPPEGGQVAENLEPVNDAAQALIDAQTDPHPSKAPPKAAVEAEEPAKAPAKARTKAADAKPAPVDDDVA